jgi:hypothetical protein
VESKGGAEGMAFGAKFDQTLAGRAARMQTVSAVDQSTLTGDTTAFVQAYNDALAAKDTAMLQVLKEDLEQSSILQSQMGLAADKISGGFEKMGEVLGVNESVKERLLMMYGDKAPKPDKVLANFNGPITIKQDFRDQDPDRVAVVFRREMERSASNILGSRT